MERVDYQSILIQDLINYHENDELNLNPWYQRRSVWTPPQKSYLVNTIFENKPIPSLYIRHSIDIEKGKSVKEVVDGQQRIRSLLGYVDGDFSARHPNHANRVKYSDLSNAEKSAFRMTSLSVGILLGSSESDVIEIFGRLNSVAKTLNPQEKRNAEWSGEFKQFFKEASTRLPIWRPLGIFSATEISRMAEVQFVSDLTLNLLEGLSDYQTAKLNRIYKQFDENFPKRKQISIRLEKTFAKIASLSSEAIEATIFSRSPLFFSLFVVVDSMRAKITNSRLEDAIFKIDDRFNSDKPISDRPRADADFHAACTSSTQRIKSRKIRDKYIRKYL
jgi:hypothetical protein